MNSAIGTQLYIPYTFANAVHVGITRLQNANNHSGYTPFLRGVFDAAISIYLDRFLNIPPARIPNFQVQSPDNDQKNSDRDTASLEEILTEITRLLDYQQQVNRSGELVAQFFSAVGDPQPIIATLGNLLLREDRDFHTIQAVEAAVRQFAQIKNWQEGAPVLIAAARYLAAHSPTMRAQGQTYQIAHRLSRGERIFED